MAIRVCEPLAAAVVFQEIAYGVKRSSAARLTPSSLNWTPTMPTLSAAVALTVMVPRTAAPEAGAVIVTVGRLLSTRTVTGPDVVRLPAASRATAGRGCEPLAVTVGRLLSTRTVTGADVVRLPAPSRATAVRVCEPLLAVVVFQEIAYGVKSSSAPRLTPANFNWTPT